MDRRAFCWATAAATTFASGASAQTPYDLVVKGGRVIDPSRGIDALLDVAIAKGRISAIKADIPAGTAEIIDGGRRPHR